ncbi:prepilin-type N-terminal cleavage/methylation domain-containing protein [Acinetobacter suaedae]|uniref:Type II secretion system protein H n=1 Tax=Acinetobacter suaedae TaxID=2609668 RepID=A0A5P1UUC1_9GAMM|nr:GspH/FimT family pseudopilin [Acinetobacter sp. C16S1]QER38766.1 prepilin-type N-terminal cleavage/methylation domain-containing protein [Acinetobacter sp. C16S1]
MFKNLGFTISELITCVAILAILVTFSIPHFNDLMSSNEAKKLRKTITIHIQKSKSDAQIYQKNVTVCASPDLQTCGNNWNQGIISFIDTNNNRQRDPSETLLYALPLNYKHGKLEWRGTLRINSVTFQGDTGLPRGSNGSFFYCSNSPKYHTRIKLSQMGHLTSEPLVTC